MANISTLSIIKALLAIVPGTIAIGIAIWQQHVIDARNREERRRRLAASRAVLPLTLSQIQAFEEKAIEAVRQHMNQVIGDDINVDLPEEPDEIEIPHISDESIEVLRSCIEDAEPNEGRALSVLVMELQTNQSRLHTLLLGRSHRSRSYPAENVLKDFFELYELTNNFYPYGRGESETIDTNVSAEAIRSAAVYFEAPDIADDLDADNQPVPPTEPQPFFRRCR